MHADETLLHPVMQQGNQKQSALHMYCCSLTLMYQDKEHQHGDATTWAVVRQHTCLGLAS